MIHLPDTNVWSCCLRHRNEDLLRRSRVEAWLPECRLSAIALMELEYGGVFVIRHLSKFSRIPGLDCEDWQSAR